MLIQLSYEVTLNLRYAVKVVGREEGGKGDRDCSRDCFAAVAFTIWLFALSGRTGFEPVEVTLTYATRPKWGHRDLNPELPACKADTLAS